MKWKFDVFKLLFPYPLGNVITVCNLLCTIFTLCESGYHVIFLKNIGQIIFIPNLAKTAHGCMHIKYTYYCICLCKWPNLLEPPPPPFKKKPNKFSCSTFMKCFLPPNFIKIFSATNLLWWPCTKINSMWMWWMTVV